MVDLAGQLGDGCGMTDRHAPIVPMPKVCVLMAVHNGAAHLEEQLASLAAQSGVDWMLLASDDGSTDNSSDILRAFAALQPSGRVAVLSGPCQGLLANFRFLLSRAPQGLALAYADQDDIWMPDKLARAMAALGRLPEQWPGLYGSTVLIADSQGAPIRRGPSPRRPPAFRNALVQNVFQGNTIVVNAAAAALLRGAEARLAGAGAAYVLHDWWAYMLISGAGGQMIHDPEPGVIYRQHPTNAIGANDGAGAGARRLRGLWQGRNAAWLSAHLAALSVLGDRLTEDANSVLTAVRQARSAGLVGRIGGFLRAGLFVQRRRAAVGLWLAILLGKL
jgi:hypothetical protein